MFVLQTWRQRVHHHRSIDDDEERKDDGASDRDPQLDHGRVKKHLNGQNEKICSETGLRVHETDGIVFFLSFSYLLTGGTHVSCECRSHMTTSSASSAKPHLQKSSDNDDPQEGEQTSCPTREIPFRLQSVG